MKTKTLKSVVKSYLMYKKPYVKKSSFYQYKYLAERYIYPEIGNIKIKDVTENMISRYLARLVEQINKKGLAKTTVISIVNVLKLALKYASDIGVLRPLAINYGIIKKHEKSVAVTLSTTDESKLIKSILSHPTCKNLGILLCLNTGLRIGEICALKWNNIDKDNGIIKIVQTVHRVYRGKNKKSELLIDSPKTTHSIREVPIPQYICDILKDYQFDGNKYFLSGTTKCIEPRGYRAYFTKFLSKLGVKQIKFHALRHTFATKCLVANVNCKIVSEILGHASVSTTMNLYMHPTLEDKRKCVELVSAM